MFSPVLRHHAREAKLDESLARPSVETTHAAKRRVGADRKFGRRARSIVLTSQFRFLNSRENDLMGLPADRMTHLAARIGAIAATTIALLFLAFVSIEAIAQGPGGESAQAKGNTGVATKDRPPGQQPAVKLGLSINAPAPFAATRC